MTKIKKVNINGVWNYDILQKILKDAYLVLYISFQKLYSEKKDNPYVKPQNCKKWHLEDIITDDLLRDEDNLPKAFEYRIVDQQKDANKNTRIDIALQWSLKFGNSYDIKVECKLLNRRNLGYYIDGGISKFKNNLYSDKLNLAGMLAYNTSGLISENTLFLNKKIKKKYSATELLMQYKIISDYPYSYRSTHSRILNSNIDIYTIVFDCSDIIQK